MFSILFLDCKNMTIPCTLISKILLLVDCWLWVSRFVLKSTYVLILSILVKFYLLSYQSTKYFLLSIFIICMNFGCSSIKKKCKFLVCNDFQRSSIGQNICTFFCQPLVTNSLHFVSYRISGVGLTFLPIAVSLVHLGIH